MGNSIHFWHTNGCSCESVKFFETENVSTWEGLEPPTFGFMLNALTIWAIRARHLLSHVFEHWLWQHRYFLSKVNIWNVNCAGATASIFYTQTGVLVKVSSFWERKCLDLRGTQTPNLQIHAECSKWISNYITCLMSVIAYPCLKFVVA